MSPFCPEDCLHHAEEQIYGREVDLGCPDCGEAWTARAFDDEGLTDDQTECPTEGCQGIGREL